jgi:hypothetical protein
MAQELRNSVAISSPQLQYSCLQIAKIRLQAARELKLLTRRHTHIQSRSMEEVQKKSRQAGGDLDCQTVSHSHNL